MLDDALKSWLREQLFERVPCNIAIIDRDFRIVEHNENFQSLFGPGRGKPCYSVYKKRKRPCKECVAQKTFEDGKYRVNDEAGVDRNGRPAYYLVHVAPIFDEQGRIPYIIEMSTDITEVKRLQAEYQVLFEKVPCYIVILNRDFRIVRANELMRKTFGAAAGQHCWEAFKKRHSKCEDCPAELAFRDGKTHTSDQVGVSQEGGETHYVVTASALHEGEPVNHVIEMAVDVTRLHELEREKIEAERLAAVGQTVAGLAHTIKNILAGLEGGLYIFKTGLEKDQRQRIEQGWEMINRNIERISVLTKNLLGFSRGEAPKVEMIDPAEPAREVFRLFQETARTRQVELTAEIQEGIAPAAFDREGIKACLENLLTNALDACQMSENENCRVTLRCREEKGAIIYEVEDNGVGMDYEIKQKVFTNFFSTKGKAGTGLGLLVTRKITQEHGGKVEFDSWPGKGSRFRLIFPRERLPRPDSGNEQEKNGEHLHAD